MVYILSLFIICCIHGSHAAHAGVQETPYQPDGVHLSFTGEHMHSEMCVTWSTQLDTDSSIVEYGTLDLDSLITGSSTFFNDRTSQYIHRVTLKGLKPQTKYYYHVGSSKGWSSIFYFTTLPLGSLWLPRVAVFGDLGVKNAQSLPRLQHDTQRGMYDAVIHIGDFAYNLESDDGAMGDAFMTQIEAIAAYVPYMTTVGNHEAYHNFTHYKNRFTMPNNDDIFYSFNMGPVHFVSINSEWYESSEYSEQVDRQFKWLQNDLETANSPDNRAQQPWIVAFGHKPMYCSTAHHHSQCAEDETKIREPLEPLFYKHGVDMYMAGHNHNYERSFPIYDNKVYNGSTEHPFINPEAPVYITTGAAGNQENHNVFEGHPADYSAVRSDEDYGYTRLQFYNSSHMYMEQVSDDKNGTIIDNMLLVKEQHGSYH